MPLSESQIVARLKDNVARVRERMAAAAARAGREHGARLIAVTKYVEPEVARLLAVECGVQDLAESRPQELWQKADALKDLPRIAWHLIGHLQRNKVKRTLPLVWYLQSVDSPRLLEEISREAVAQNLIANVLIEVNVSGDAAKHGVSPDQLEPLLSQVRTLPRVFVRGLMTMAGLESDPEQTRREFAALRQLKERMDLIFQPLELDLPPQVTMIELSMGMSGDYEIAIEEGATMVRIGSALFEGIV
jgi:pyridoxal phosphate enzyme (YggS family)